MVHNKCERELLEITKAIASLCGASIKMETEPSARGGLKGWITITAKSEKKTPPAKIALVTTLVTATLVTPIHASIGQAARQLIDTLFREKEFSEEQRAQLQLEIGTFKAAVNAMLPKLDQSNLLKKRRSNFYDVLRKYHKVKTISIVMEDASRKPISEEQFMSREEFNNFILISDQLKPLVMENVSIEIISPVLNKGKYKWKGLYNGSLISFTMKSDEFMSMVHSGKVEFKSGTTIHCTLEIEKKINSEGMERVTSYNIISVGSYFENGKSVETTESKQQKQKQTAAKRQLDLFGN
jgi:hypothetical protein